MMHAMMINHFAHAPNGTTPARFTMSSSERAAPCDVDAIEALLAGLSVVADEPSGPRLRDYQASMIADIKQAWHGAGARSVGRAARRVRLFQTAAETRYFRYESYDNVVQCFGDFL